MNNTKKERVNLLLRSETAKELRRVKNKTGLPIGYQVEQAIKAKELKDTNKN